MKNGQSSGSKLPESDRADMDIFLERIRQLMPVLGADALVPVSAASAESSETGLLTCEIKGLKAFGRQTPTGFIVLQRSQAVLEERPSAQNYPNTLTTRNKLIEDGDLVPKVDHFEFSRDVEFTSPSAAAAVVHGGSANGLASWKNDAGQTLKELEEG